MELRDYWLAFKTGWAIVLGVVVLALVAGAVLTWTATPQYVSTTRLFVAAQVNSDDVEELSERNAIAQARVASYVAVASGSAVADQVSEAVGFEVDYEKDVLASVVAGTVVMEVSVTDSDPERARDIAAAYAEVLPGTIEEIEVVGDSPAAQVRARVIDEAQVPDSPESPSLPRNLVLSLLLGVVAGLGLALVRFLLLQERPAEQPDPDSA